MQCMKCVILLDFKNKLYAGNKMHLDIQAWDYVILLDFKNKLYARTKMMLISLLEFWDGDRLQQNFVVSTGNQSSLLNCIVYNKSVCNELVFTAKLYHYRVVLSAANQFSLSKYVVYSESIFIA